MVDKIEDFQKFVQNNNYREYHTPEELKEFLRENDEYLEFPNDPDEQDNRAVHYLAHSPEYIKIYEQEVNEYHRNNPLSAEREIVDITIKNKDGLSPTAYAQQGVYEFNIQGFETVDDNYNAYNSPEKLKIFLSLDENKHYLVNPNKRDKKGNTAAHYLEHSREYLNIFQQAVKVAQQQKRFEWRKQEVDLTILNNDGLSPSQYTNNNDKLLIAYEIQELKENQDLSASQKEERLRTFLSSKENKHYLSHPNKQDKQGNTALHYLTQSPEYMKIYEKAVSSYQEISHSMITSRRKKIDLNITNNNGLSPIMYATRQVFNKESIKYLLQKNEQIDLTLLDTNGHNILTIAFDEMNYGIKNTKSSSPRTRERALEIFRALSKNEKIDQSNVIAKLDNKEVLINPDNPILQGAITQEIEKIKANSLRSEIDNYKHERTRHPIATYQFLDQNSITLEQFKSFVQENKDELFSNPNTQDEFGSTPLHYIMHNHELVKEFIEGYKTYNEKSIEIDFNEFTANQPVAKEQVIEMNLDEFIADDTTIDFNILDLNTVSPLYNAVSEGNLRSIDLLLRENYITKQNVKEILADPKNQGIFKNKREGYIKDINTILESQDSTADISALLSTNDLLIQKKNFLNQGLNPLKAYKFERHDKDFNFLITQEDGEELLKNPNAQDKQGNTSLHYLASAPTPDFFRRFVEHATTDTPIDLLIKNIEEITPLQKLINNLVISSEDKKHLLATAISDNMIKNNQEALENVFAQGSSSRKLIVDAGNMAQLWSAHYKNEDKGLHEIKSYAEFKIPMEIEAKERDTILSNPNEQDKSDNTRFHYLASSAHLSLIKDLMGSVKSPVNFSIKNQKGHTPLDKLLANENLTPQEKQDILSKGINNNKIQKDQTVTDAINQINNNKIFDAKIEKAEAQIKERVAEFQAKHDKLTTYSMLLKKRHFKELASDIHKILFNNGIITKTNTKEENDIFNDKQVADMMSSEYQEENQKIPMSDKITLFIIKVFKALHYTKTITQWQEKISANTKAKLTTYKERFPDAVKSMQANTRDAIKKLKKMQRASGPVNKILFGSQSASQKSDRGLSK